jgi:hypothetical protein
MSFVYPPILSIQHFKNSCGSLSGSDAHGDHAVFLLAAFEFVQDLHCELGPGSAQRMAQGYGAAVHIHFFGIQSQIANNGLCSAMQRLRSVSIRLISSKFIPLCFSTFWNGCNRPDTHFIRFHTGYLVINQPGNGF